MARTEQDILTRAPIEVTLGGKTYEVTPLTIAESAAWRRRLGRGVADVLGGMQVQRPDGSVIRDEEALGRLLPELFATAPDLLIDLMWAYAPILPRKEIEKAATEIELLEAASEVFKLGLPLAKPIIATAVAMMNMSRMRTARSGL